MTLVTGARIGPYAIVAPLGAGGMGEVYRAKDTRLDRTVAIKILPRHIANDATRRQRFEREARAISSLSHPHICALFDIGEQDGVPFLVMEHLEGETLDRRLVRGPLPIEHVLLYGMEMAEALEHAHRQRIIHRDLKPSNIMLTRAGVKLLDFGVAKLWARDEVTSESPVGLRAAETVTEEGTIVGTLQYMAPEQLEGRDVDARTDLFAFGALMYEMVTGRRAFEGSSQASVVAKILGVDPPSLSVALSERQDRQQSDAARLDVLPPLLDRIVARCLAKNPDDRWQTANDLRQALKWVAEGTGEVAKPRPAAAARDWRRQPLRWLVAGVALAIAAITTLASVMTSTSREPANAQSFQFEIFSPEDTSFGLSPAVMSISPDGRAVAFHANSQEGMSSIWVRSLDALAARQLPGTEGAVQPVWSADSRFVLAGGGGRLRKIDISSGLAQIVTDTPGGQISWSRDGVLLFKLGPQSPLYQLSALGGALVAATTLDEGRAEVTHGWPQFLPDGRHFVYHAQSTKPEHDGWLSVGSLDSPNGMPLLKTDSHAAYAPPGYLLYLYSNTLVAHEFDADTLRLSGEPLPIVHNVDYNNVSRRGAFSVSNTGTLVYRSPAETELVWFDRTGKPLESIAPLARYANPALSPSERQVAIERVDPATGTTDIWLLDLARGGRLRLTDDPAPDQKPIWSPDGQRIAFTSARAGKVSIYQTASSGAGQNEMLLAGAGLQGTDLEDWTRDGQFLIYSTALQNSPKATGLIFALTRMSLVGDPPPVQFVQSKDRISQAQLSPDGGWITYSSRESGRAEVYVQRLSSGAERLKISTNGGIEPKWRGDGKELFYLALDQSVMSVSITVTSTLEPGQPQRLFGTRMLGFQGTNTRNQYVVTADGQRFLINEPPQGTNSSPISVVVNWTDALKKNQP